MLHLEASLRGLWLLQHLDAIPELSYPLNPCFRVDKAVESCFTPRRNTDVEDALFALRGLLVSPSLCVSLLCLCLCRLCVCWCQCGCWC